MTLTTFKFLVFVSAFPLIVNGVPEIRIPRVTHTENPKKTNLTLPILLSKITTTTTVSPKRYTTFNIESPSPSNNTFIALSNNINNNHNSDQVLSTNVTFSTPASTSTPTPLSSGANPNGKFGFHFPMIVSNFTTFSKTAQSQNSNEDVEETFTYQVKKQNRNKFFADKDILKKSELVHLQGQSQDDKLDAHKNVLESNKKVDELESKVGTLLERLSLLESSIGKTSYRTNATIKALQTQVGVINENYRANENSIKEIRTNIIMDKTRVDGQLQTLSMHLRNLYNSTWERNQNVSSTVKQMNLSVENIAHDVRMNDMKIRFNQKALTTLDRTVQSNNEKITEMTESVGPKWVEQTTGCGGVLVADAGILSYKFRQPYLNNEQCIWTIRANQRHRIMLQLLEDGFQNASNSDFITVTEFNEDLTLVTSSRIEHKNRAIHTFRGPLIFVSFYSDSSTPGNGFTLKFQGQGNSTAGDFLNAVRYSHSHWKDAHGQIDYPEDKNSLYQPNERATFVINALPPTARVRINIRQTDMEKEEGCEYDSVSFYGSVKASFALAKKYCDQQKTFNGEWLQSSDGTFIVVFRSDASSQFRGFQFTWESY